jgi:phage gp29-like protein
MSTILDVNGQPMTRAVLTQQIATPSVIARRNITSNHPSIALDPVRLGAILRMAETIDPTTYLELAEDMEEKDLHYLGVLGTRKRAVAQLEITVEAATDSARDVEIANFVRTFIGRAELEDEIFHMMDSVGKGYSVTEIIWDVSEKQYMPARLEWCEPKWFRFDEMGQNLRMVDGMELKPLMPYKFVPTRIAAKSGLPVKGGLARAVAWCWLFKNFTIKDWVIFAEAYGHPVRIGKYGPGATPADKATLLDAVMNISSDFAAIIPQSMVIEQLQADAPKSVELFQSLANYLDQQVSKVVVGQTATTDAIKGGYAVGKVHNEVRGDIQRSDARLLASSINRHLVRPMVDLNFGPQKNYPMVYIGNKEAADHDLLGKTIPELVDRGLKIGMSSVRDKVGFPDPDEGEEVLQPKGGAAPAAVLPPAPKPGVKDLAADIAGGRALDSVERLGAQLEAAASPALDSMIDRLKELVNDPSISSLAELQTRILDLYPGLDPSAIAEKLASAMLTANLVGRDEVDDA